MHKNGIQVGQAMKMSLHAHVPYYPEGFQNGPKPYVRGLQHNITSKSEETCTSLFFKWLTE